jgi:hypothetical protein
LPTSICELGVGAPPNARLTYARGNGRSRQAFGVKRHQVALESGSIALIRRGSGNTHHTGIHYPQPDVRHAGSTLIEQEPHTHTRGPPGSSSLVHQLGRVSEALDAAHASQRHASPSGQMGLCEAPHQQRDQQSTPRGSRTRVRAGPVALVRSALARARFVFAAPVARLQEACDTPR